MFILCIHLSIRQHILRLSCFKFWLMNGKNPYYTKPVYFLRIGRGTGKPISKASRAGMASDQGRAVIDELNKLSIEQVKQVKEQVDSEVGLLQDSLTRIRTAAARYEMASKALHNIAAHPAGKQMLVPLTASLYVPGSLDNADKVLIDVGTGYYVEKTMQEGKEYCERKINFLKSNHDKLVEVSAEKKNAADQVTLVLQAKLRQAMSAK